VEPRSNGQNNVSIAPHSKGLGAPNRQRVARIQYASSLKVTHDWSAKLLGDRKKVSAGVDRAGPDHDHRPPGAFEQPNGFGDCGGVGSLRLETFELVSSGGSEARAKDIRGQLYRCWSSANGKGGEGARDQGRRVVN
jgi:hypothetical protein